MQRLLGRTVVLSTLLVLFSSFALAQYQSTKLVSNLSGKAKYKDSLLKNPWGLAYGPGLAFWVSAEATGWSTLYDGKGNPQSLQVIIPSAGGTGAGTPTGIVYNGSSEFKIDDWTSLFIFATLDGTISGWSHFNPGAALIPPGFSNPGASYTGLAITNKTSGNYLFAADAANNKVDIYDANFNLVSSFTDPSVPAGFAPFGIQDIDGKVFVAYAATSGGGGGYIEVFEEDGTFVRQFTHGKPLNQPWGFAVAPADFGPLSDTLLITNNATQGTINGFDRKTGKLVGTMMDATNQPISLDGIWGIEFGGGSAANGGKKQLFFTAGPNDTNGYFGVIELK